MLQNSYMEGLFIYEFMQNVYTGEHAVSRHKNFALCMPIVFIQDRHLWLIPALVQKACIIILS